MNFNRSTKPDYDLKANQIDELISLYGVECDYLESTKENIDTVLRDFQYRKLNKDNSRKIMLMPEDPAGFDDEISFGLFGIQDNRSENLFISRKTIIHIFPDFDDSNGYNDIFNQLIVFPSGKVMEISDFKCQVPGINNLYLNPDEKSSYLMTVIPYSFNKQDEIEEEPDEIIQEEMETLDDFFTSLDETEEKIEVEADKVSNTDSVFGSLS